ncbi:enoyl-CoA hydratase-related protein [Cytobacillus sp. FSL W7-1323]|uniref:enoyl-CoA hydratase/isomerase family protein n=1 Tax=Cytobacillus TaxID=2675230 RepID=UPI00278317E5|nr:MULTISPECIES: enoyl-CoA hydratase-related protein [Cytobacillus]MDQ0184579.1 enoyl-CoA hydratase/carnithine racemase [Cytobacillus kochii]MEA1852203.1 enoyl-CoA hydratase-related protein [Cytobacillus sp. OWB-43]
MKVETYETIDLKKTHHNQIAILRLNRPQSMNALNTKMASEIVSSLEILKYDPDLRVIILTAEGDKSFCVGADLKERNGMSQRDWKKQHDIFERVTELIREFPFPIICAVNGYALGGGMEIALSCDMRTANENASFGLPEAKLGLIPGIGGTQMAIRVLPLAIAKEILFTGKRISATEAETYGLVNKVCREESLLEETIKLASEIAENAPLSLKALKKVVNKGADCDLSTGIALELEAYYRCANSNDRLEGIYAFNEKRKPQWQGK